MTRRADGRRPDELRPLTIEVDYLENPHGSALITQGKTKVLCTAMVQEEVPRWLRNQGRGWMTAEYSLLPASTGDRVEREASRGKQQGRTVEIQRLIGRALRAVVDFKALGERTIWFDCDVLQADGGTRCAAICGAYVAGRRALDRFGLSRAFTDSVAAVSVGVVDGVPLLDLDYSEDSSADTDMNVVMTGDGRLIEVQATAERDPFSRETLDELLELADTGIAAIGDVQDEATSVALLVDIPAGGSPVSVLEAIESRGGRVISLEIAQEGDRRSIAVDVELRDVAAPTIVAGVGEIDGVLAVHWTE